MSSRGVGGSSQLPFTICSVPVYVQISGCWRLCRAKDVACYIFGMEVQDLEVHMMLFERQLNGVARRVPSTSPASQHSEQMVGKCPKTCMEL